MLPKIERKETSETEHEPEDRGVMKCPTCHSVLPEPKETYYITDKGKRYVSEYICVSCGTRVIVPKV